MVLRASSFVMLWLMMAGVCAAEPIAADLSGVRPGAIGVSSEGGSLVVRWSDAAKQAWVARFALDSKMPLITSITADGRTIVEKATPYYHLSTGKRTGGWDAFFDFPPMAAEGTRSFVPRFHPARVTARSTGDRVEVSFDGMEAGIFSGSLRYVFYPGSSLIEQDAVMKTSEADIAYTYDMGLQMTAEGDRSPGGNMASTIVYYDAEGKLQTETPPYGSERHTLKVHYRAVAAKTGAGSIVAFPSPHRYLFARDYSTNMGYAWYSSWRGKVGIGIQQPLDDNTQIYPWMNAPPGTEQEMGMFFLLGSAPASQTLDRALAYTRKDVYQHVPGYVTFAPHWHFAFTEQAVAYGPKWVPPFKEELERTGVDAAMIMDFHGMGIRRIRPGFASTRSTRTTRRAGTSRIGASC